MLEGHCYFTGNFHLDNLKFTVSIGQVAKIQAFFPSPEGSLVQQLWAGMRRKRRPAHREQRGNHDWDECSPQVWTYSAWNTFLILRLEALGGCCGSGWCAGMRGHSRALCKVSTLSSPSSSHCRTPQETGQLLPPTPKSLKSHNLSFGLHPQAGGLGWSWEGHP